jgi:hypothetical protein
MLRVERVLVTVASILIIPILTHSRPFSEEE